MTPVQLTEIIRTADTKSIMRQLKELGYIDCKKHKQLCKLSIETLFKGTLEETETLPDSKNNRTYQGAIFTQVKDCEPLEFIVVNINDHKNLFPIDMLIWAKEVQ